MDRTKSAPYARKLHKRNRDTVQGVKKRIKREIVLSTIVLIKGILLYIFILFSKGTSINHVRLLKGGRGYVDKKSQNSMCGREESS